MIKKSIIFLLVIITLVIIAGCMGQGWHETIPPTPTPFEVHIMPVTATPTPFEVHIMPVTETPTPFEVHILPVTETPAPTSWLEVEWQEGSRGIGSGVGCPAATGPYSEHEFPRLYHFFANQSRALFYTSVLDQIALFDVTEWMMDAGYWDEQDGFMNMPSGDRNPFAYLRNKNPDTKIAAYVPAFYFWWNPVGINSMNTDVSGPVADMVKARDWWLRPSGPGGYTKYIVQFPPKGIKSAGELLAGDGALLNLSLAQLRRYGDQTIGQWYANYLAGEALWDRFYGVDTRYFDIIRFDVADGTPHSMSGTFWDLNRDGQSDQYNEGKWWMDQKMTGEYALMLSDLSSQLDLDGGIVVGNSHWQPEANDINSLSPYTFYANGAMDEDWPLFAWYDALSCGGINTSSACPSYGPGGYADAWSFHMRQYLNWMDHARRIEYYDHSQPIYVITVAAIGDLRSIFATYIKSEAQLVRFTLGSALLEDGYSTIQKGNKPPGNCDECWINLSTGQTSKTLSGTGWMGCPLGPAVDADGGQSLRQLLAAGEDIGLKVWKREYTNALVVINPTTSYQVIDAGSGWQKIRGSWDVTHNNGQTISGGISIAPMDAYVLIRSGANTPTPWPTSTPDSFALLPTSTPTTGPTSILTPSPTWAAFPGFTPTVTPTPTPTPTATPGLGACEYNLAFASYTISGWRDAVINLNKLDVADPSNAKLVLQTGYQATPQPDLFQRTIQNVLLDVPLDVPVGAEDLTMLWLWVEGYSGDPMFVYPRPLNVDWTDEATWNTYDGVTTWTQPGAFDAADAGWPTRATMIDADNAGDWISIDISGVGGVFKLEPRCEPGSACTGQAIFSSANTRDPQQMPRISAQIVGGHAPMATVTATATATPVGFLAP